MRKLLMIIGMVLMMGSAFAGTTQISPVSNSNQTVVVNDNFDSLQGGLNSLQGAYNTLSVVGNYFTNGVLNIANSQTIDALLPSQTSNSGKVLITNGANSYWGASGAPYAPGTLVEVSAAAATNSSTNSYLKVREFTPLPRSGIIRTSFSISSGNGNTTYGRIYKNGVAYGTQQTTTTGYTAVEDLAFSVGDVISLWIYNATGIGSSGTFYLYVTIPTVIQNTI